MTTRKNCETQEADDEENDEEVNESEVEGEKENMDIQNCIEHLKNLENLQASDFVHIGLKKNKGSNQVYSNQHFVGQVIQMEEDEEEIKYMKTSGSSFVWP